MLALIPAAPIMIHNYKLLELDQRDWVKGKGQSRPLRDLKNLYPRFVMLICEIVTN